MCSPVIAKQGGEEEEYSRQEGQDSLLSRFGSSWCRLLAVLVPLLLELQMGSAQKGVGCVWGQNISL